MSLILNENGSPAGTAPAADVVKDSDTANFMTDVIEASREVPVIVDFWAPWCEPCKQLGPALEKRVAQQGGRVRMVKINVDENQDLAMQLRVQSIPTVYAFHHGQPVDAFQGALPESQLAEFVKRLTGGGASPVEDALAQADEALEAGEAPQALALYQQVLQADGTNNPAVAGVIRALIAVGEPERARAFADSLDEARRRDTKVAAALSALALAESGADAGDLETLRAAVAADPDNHQARYDFAVAAAAQGAREEAVEALLEIMRRDRTWNDEAARTHLLTLFEAFGPTDPLTVKGRRRLSSLLFS